jgi:hypothetical protein
VTEVTKINGPFANSPKYPIFSHSIDLNCITFNKGNLYIREVATNPKNYQTIPKSIYPIHEFIFSSPITEGCHKYRQVAIVGIRAKKTNILISLGKGIK